MNYSRREKSRAREKCCALTFSGLFEVLKIFFSQILFFPLKIKVLQIKVFIFKINFFFSYVPKLLGQKSCLVYTLLSFTASPSVSK